MSNISREYYEDIIPDDPELYERFISNLHDYKPGKPEGNYSVRRCIEVMYRRDGTEYVCGGYSHDSMHNTMDCCYCKHGVYLHTSYDIPCGRCEYGDDEDYV